MTSPDRPARPAIAVTRRLPALIEARMADLFDARFNSDDLPLPAKDIIAAMTDCDVLVPTVTDTIGADIIAAAPDRLRLIANFGNGVDHIDLRAARDRGIMVTNTPGVLTGDTADMTLALILSVPRRLSEGQEMIRTGTWSGWSPAGMLGHRIAGKRLGIIGMGRIGRAVAARARAFGLEIAYHNRSRLPQNVEQDLAATYSADLDALMADADIVTIHCPLSDSTRGLISADRIARMKDSAYLINTSRGEIIDENALIDALQQQRIAGAGLDVYTHEPAVDPRLIALANVTLIPHMGSATIEARHDMGTKVIANIRAWVDGHRPPDQVLDGWR